jgi:hypothetical protein
MHGMQVSRRIVGVCSQNPDTMIQQRACSTDVNAESQVRILGVLLRLYKVAALNSTSVLLLLYLSKGLHPTVQLDPSVQAMVASWMLQTKIDRCAMDTMLQLISQEIRL